MTALLKREKWYPAGPGPSCLSFSHLDPPFGAGGDAVGLCEIAPVDRECHVVDAVHIKQHLALWYVAEGRDVGHGAREHLPALVEDAHIDRLAFGDAKLL